MEELYTYGIEQIKKKIKKKKKKMFKYRNNVKYVNKRNVRTRLHDAPVFITKKTNNEKYKQNVFYYGAIKWNNLPVNVRNIETYETFKFVHERWSMRWSEDRSGPLVTCTGNTGRSPVLTGELVPVDWHGLPVQVTNGPDQSSDRLTHNMYEVE